MTCLLTSASCHTKSVRLYAYDMSTLSQCSLLFAHGTYVYTCICLLQPRICECSMLRKQVLLGVAGHMWCVFCLIRQGPSGDIEWPQPANILVEQAISLQGLLPSVAPLLPHLAEDAWESMPWQQPAKSVFQAGWFQTPQDWATLSQVQSSRHSAVQ